MKIKASRLTKQYKNKIAVDRVSFEIGRGVTGLLGANGAGKTTLMRMMAGILKPTGGEIDADGISVLSEDYRALLGYLPQDFGYYPEFTARRFMMYMSSLKGLSKKNAKDRTEELLELVGLSDVADKKIGSFSGGMKQRIGIAQAFINDPEILILDEPTAGLDPKERARFRSLIADVGKSTTVLFSTHIVSDLEQIADNVLIMKDGALVFNGGWDNQNGDLEQFYIEEMEAI